MLPKINIVVHLSMLQLIFKNTGTSFYFRKPLVIENNDTKLCEYDSYDLGEDILFFDYHINYGIILIVNYGLIHV